MKKVSCSNQAMWSVLAMTTIWLIVLTSKINDIYDGLSDASFRIYELEVENIIKDDMPKLEEVDRFEDTSRGLTPFEQIFKEMRNNYGSGVVFNWNGDEYTTNYLEENNNLK